MDYHFSMTDRLTQQLDFLMDIDALKRVERASLITGGSRYENTAEHSWHVSMFALVLSEYAAEHVDQNRVLRMLLIHDIVEIDAGDQPIHAAPNPLQAANEVAAAARLFGILPSDQGDELYALWQEFEEATTAEARLAKALDRLPPILLNSVNAGGSWVDYDVTRSQLIKRTQAIEVGAPTLWPKILQIYDEAVERGWVSEV